MSDKKPSRIANLTYAAVAGQAGCATLVIIFIALFLGLWLDRQMGVRGPFVIGLLLISVPISLFVMVRIALGMIRKITPPERQTDDSEPYATKEDNFDG